MDASRGKIQPAKSIHFTDLTPHAIVEREGTNMKRYCRLTISKIGNIKFIWQILIVESPKDGRIPDELVYQATNYLLTGKCRAEFEMYYAYPETSDVPEKVSEMTLTKS